MLGSRAHYFVAMTKIHKLPTIFKKFLDFHQTTQTN